MKVLHSKKVLFQWPADGTLPQQLPEVAVLRVNAADAAASWIRSHKGEIGHILEEITAEKV